MKALPRTITLYKHAEGLTLYKDSISILCVSGLRDILTRRQGQALHEHSGNVDVTLHAEKVKGSRPVWLEAPNRGPMVWSTYKELMSGHARRGMYSYMSRMLWRLLDGMLPINKLREFYITVKLEHL